MSSVYFITYLREIADYLINQYNLKKDFDYKKLELFRNNINQKALLITKGGKTNLAAGTAYLIGKENNQEDYALFYIGLCETNTKIANKLLLFNKVTDFETQKSCYPDILVDHSLKEAALLTFVGNKKNLPKGYEFFDAEAFGFMEASLQFLPPHFVYCLSIIRSTNQKVLEILKTNWDEFEKLIFGVEKLFKENTNRLTAEERKALTTLSKKMHFTKAMEYLLIKKAEELATKKNFKAIKIIEEFSSSQVNNKKERSSIFKKILENLEK